ncbi:transferrin-like [Condylostylus longicornis]|uniref:transferrin-like n=1 Tax=Condylostylus longicornis TaxID=2530218 RepID=UPI00244E1D19|nr:transferrin-like [Condylostylus longicornis]
MCVPEEYIEDCLDFLGKVRIVGPQIDCIAARDRIECLELLKKNKVDVVIIEPEDMQYAASIDNGKFRIVGELRTSNNKTITCIADKFEDEDWILIKKSSTIKNLKDLKGLKSCHPNFESYYGYRIPVTILKKHGLLQVSKDPTIPAIQRELQALSEFFQQSCIVGPYSEDESKDQEWKKKYPNLCQLCENPIECDENDKYANYKGPIECLINGEGDVAFTKKSEIHKYFGITNEEGNTYVDINDYEILCEDGSRQSINGTGCALAKRPNKAYYGNTYVANHLLIDGETNFYWFIENLTLEKALAGFEPYFEKHESHTDKLKLCVTTNTELEKCDILTKIAFIYRVRPELECYFSESGNCAADVASDKAHIAIVPGYNWTIVEKEFSNLKRVAYENWDYNGAYIALFSVLSDKIKPFEEYEIKFDKTDKRAHKAACLLHLILKDAKDCDSLYSDVIESDSENYIQVVKIEDRHNFGDDKAILCLDKTFTHIGNHYACNLDIHYQNAIFVNGNKSETEIESYKNVMTTIGTMFGYNGLYSKAFNLFAQFKGTDDVLFNDYTLNLDGAENFDDFEEKYHDAIIKVLKYNWKKDKDRNKKIIKLKISLFSRRTTPVLNPQIFELLEVPVFKYQD